MIKENGAQVYAYMARHEKDPHNRDILLHMSQDEKAHADYWRSFSQKDIRPNRLQRPRIPSHLPGMRQHRRVVVHNLRHNPKPP